jgi:translation elongation factor EF-Ts
MKHFLNTQDWSRSELDALLARAAQFKRNLKDNSTVNAFVLYVVGEGIEKKGEDFAAEVAAMTKPPKEGGPAIHA